MRRRVVPIAVAALFSVLYAYGQSQDPAQNGSAPKPAAPAAAPSTAPAQPAVIDATDQTVSLGDVARAARAKRQNDANSSARTAKLLDDDNLPRGVYAEDAPTGKSGSQAPGATGTDSSLAEFRGKVVLLDFWASWCGPCRRALPSLKRLQAVYGSSDFAIVSVSEDDDENAWREFVSSNEMTWAQRLDTDGSIQGKYGVRALPTYVLLGRDGKVAHKYVGEDPAETILERIGPDLKATFSAKQ